MPHEDMSKQKALGLPGRELASAVLTTERAVAVWVLGALAGLWLLRRGFRSGALGD